MTNHIPPIFAEAVEEINDKREMQKEEIKKYFNRCKKEKVFTVKVSMLKDRNLYCFKPRVKRAITKIRLDNLAYLGDAEFYHYNFIAVDWLLFRIHFQLSFYPASWLEMEELEEFSI